MLACAPGVCGSRVCSIATSKPGRNSPVNSKSSGTHPPLGEQQVGWQRVAVIGLPHRPSLLEESMEGGAVVVVEDPARW